MEKLSSRQIKIVQFISENHGVDNQAILNELSKTVGDVSRYTLVRELFFLMKKNFIRKEGAGRGVKYYEKSLKRESGEIPEQSPLL